MDMQMAERLVARRKAAGYSQEALAAELGVSRQAVSKWERGEASPDTDNLIALAGLYGVTLDELLFGKASPDPKDAGEKDENPAKSRVGISLREGIHVVGPKRGEEVHVGWDGIHASDAEGNTVESDPEGEGVTINGTHYESWHDAHEELGHDLKGKSDLRRRWDAFPFPALVLVAYLAVGWATDQWVAALLLGFLVPLYYTTWWARHWTTRDHSRWSAGHGRSWQRPTTSGRASSSTAGAAPGWSFRPSRWYA